jgi:prepilin-type processing-associated H-X9-DG protein
LCVGNNKPFNPLLGETLQGHFDDGSKFYCEHTSHHPPVSNFLFEDVDELYKLYGYYEVTGKMGANNIVSGMRGPNNIVFADGHHIRYGVPSFKLGGTVMGERTVEIIGSITFEDLTNNRKAVIIMNTFKKAGWLKSSQGNKDNFMGIIYDSKPLKGDKDSIKKNYGKDIEFVHDIKSIKDIRKQICDIDGSWLNSL